MSSCTGNVIGPNVSREQAEDFHRATDEIQKLYKLSDGFRIIDTAAPNMLMALSRQLKQKRSLLIFLDGNKGGGSANPAKENLSRIPFLGSTLKVRHGSAFLSHLTGAPLLPVMAQRSPGNLAENLIKFFPQIEPGQTTARQEFLIAAMQTLYQHLADAVKVTPAQWECWRYINNAMDTNKQTHAETPVVDHMDGLLHFNQKRYLLTETHAGEQTHHLLFDRLEFGSNILSSPFYKLLDAIKQVPKSTASLLGEEGVSHELVETLLRKEILYLDPTGVTH